MLPSDIAIVLSGGLTNADPAKSLGGVASSMLLGGAELFADYTTTAGGLTDYRCIYLFNEHASQFWKDIVIYFVSNDEYLPLMLGVQAANEVQTISFGGPPASGSLTLGLGTVGVAKCLGDPDLGVVAANLQRSLNRIYPLSGVSVGQTVTGGLRVTFAGEDSHRAMPLLQVVSNDLGVSCTIRREVAGGPIDTTAPLLFAPTAVPPGVVFQEPSQVLPIILGVLRPKEYFPLWIKRAVPSNAPTGTVAFSFAISGNGVTPTPPVQYDFFYTSTGMAVQVSGRAVVGFTQGFRAEGGGGVLMGGAADYWKHDNKNDWVYPEPGLEDIEMQGGPKVNGKAQVYKQYYQNQYEWVAEPVDELTGAGQPRISGTAEVVPPNPFIGATNVPKYPCMLPLAWEVDVAGIWDIGQNYPCCPWLNGKFILTYDPTSQTYRYHNANPDVTYEILWPKPNFDGWQINAIAHDYGHNAICGNGVALLPPSDGSFFCEGRASTITTWTGGSTCWLWSDITATIRTFQMTVKPVGELLYTQDFHYQYVGGEPEKFPMYQPAVRMGGKADTYNPVDLCAKSLVFTDPVYLLDYSFPTQYRITVVNVKSGTCKVPDLLNGSFTLTLQQGSCDWTYVNKQTGVSWRLWLQRDGGDPPRPRWQIAGLVSGCGTVFATNWGSTGATGDPFIVTCGLVSTLLKSDGTFTTTGASVSMVPVGECFPPHGVVLPNAFAATMSGGVRVGGSHRLAFKYTMSGGVSMGGNDTTSYGNRWFADTSVPVRVGGKADYRVDYRYEPLVSVYADVLVGHVAGGETVATCTNCTHNLLLG